MRARAVPLVATAALVATTMAWTLGYTWQGSYHLVYWRVPADIWGTMRAAHMVAWGGLGGIYGAGAGLVAFAGAAIVLLPVALLSSALGLTESFPLTLPHPTAWLVLGPYESAVAGIALLAADAWARRLGVGRARRVVLAGAGAAALWGVTVWGHPEDAVAVGLLLYAGLLVLDGRVAGAGWLLGASVAVQPLVLLGVPVLLAAVGWRRSIGLVARAAALPALLVGVPLVHDPRDTLRAVVDQPNFPRIDHVTPWTALAPHLGGHGASLAVAGGPGRLAAVLLAVALVPWVAHRRHDPRSVLWALGIALGLRVVTESVLDPFYLWPPLAVGLVAAAAVGSRWRLVAAAITAVGVTAGAQVHLPWVWWWVMAVGAVAVVLVAGARPVFAGARSSSVPRMPLGEQEPRRPMAVRLIR